MPLISISHSNNELQDFYALSCYRDIWTEMGLEVTVSDGFAENADLCILHHDQTRLNPETLPTAPAGVPVLNGQVLDISKRHYSSLMVKRNDPWDGPVIVKSNLNHYGAPERRNKPRKKKKTLAQKLQRRLLKHDWTWARTLPTKTYPVLETLRDVPGWVWRREDLLVERFMPEREGDLYCLRGWMFMGSASYGYRLFATDPLVKTGTMVRHEYLDETPPELERFRAERKFDFGKFDYVMHDGQAILLDANKTPSFTGERKTKRLTRLARAVEEFLP